MGHVGKTLRKMREEKGLTIEDVARMTRIRAEILHGMEEGDYHQISGGPFLRGFVKSYAQSLGKSDREIEDLLDSITLPRTEAAKQPSATDQPTYRNWYWVGGLAIVAVVVAILLMGRGKNGAPVPPPQPPSQAEPPSQAPLPSQPQPQPVPSQPKPETPAAAKAPAATLPEVSQPKPPAPAPPGPQIQETFSVHLEISATEPCWVRVRLDGEPSRQVLLAAGETRSWDARKDGTLTLGNAGGVVVRVNGREYTGLGAQNQVLRDIAVTPEGLGLPEGRTP